MLLDSQAGCQCQQWAAIQRMHRRRPVGSEPRVGQRDAGTTGVIKRTRLIIPTDCPRHSISGQMLISRAFFSSSREPTDGSAKRYVARLRATQQPGPWRRRSSQVPRRLSAHHKARAVCPRHGRFGRRSTCGVRHKVAVDAHVRPRRPQPMTDDAVSVSPPCAVRRRRLNKAVRACSLQDNRRCRCVSRAWRRMTGVRGGI